MTVNSPTELTPLVSTITDEKDKRQEDRLLQEALAALQAAEGIRNDGNYNTNSNRSSASSEEDDDGDDFPESLEPQSISFLPLSVEEASPEDYDESLAFLTSEDDLVAALLSMNVGGDDEDEDRKFIHESTQESPIQSSSKIKESFRETPDTTTTSTSLPEIEFDFADETFLVDPDQLHAVFDDEDENNCYYSDKIKQESETEEDDTLDRTQIVEDGHFELHFKTSVLDQDEFPVDIDLETEQLYQELASMSLSERNQNSQEDPFSIDPFSAEGIPSGTDGLPFYLWCQPCDVIGNEDPDGDEFDQLDPTLPPIAEDQPLDDLESEIVRQAKENHIHDLQMLYQSSQRQDNKEDGIMRLDHSDPLLQELEAKSSRREEDPRSVEAARQWMTAFGVPTTNENNDDNENASVPPKLPISCKDTLKSFLGHKETIYGVDFNMDGRYIATASQDANINVWETATNKLLTSLKGHDTAYECLRVSWANPTWANEVLDREGRFSNILASAGADGMVKLWTCKDIKSGVKQGEENGWKCEFELDHASFLGRNVPRSVAEEEEIDKPQVYALQFIDHWKVFTKMLREHHCGHDKNATKGRSDNKMDVSSDESDNDKNSFLMTSSDEFIHLWEVEGHPFDQQLQLEDHKIRLLQDNELKLKEVMSLHFGSLDRYGYGVTPCSVTGRGLKLPPPPKPDQSGSGGDAFGGERNPQNIIFVFDAAYCPASGLLGVALSDGSLRLVNGRGVCVSVITLPGNKSHLTSFCWDKTGCRLATCVATGHLITWSLDLNDYHAGGSHNIVATCTAILEGGHQVGRPLFGSRYCGKDEDLLVSWGVDGALCLWSSHSKGNVHAPMAILKQDPGYPIYAVDISERNVAIGGGGSDGGFIGIPLYVADLPDAERLKEEQNSKIVKEEDPPVPKKSKTED
ncbi:serine/threonine protein kinase containing WD-40 repeat domain [Nitzschia inconspicua]|uniref:Serine/threonine protein kinase containing WD-40 repeat domain n=1 Tax=Nitzschia inconspicua TaxID=303405 RepID=A0A9K3PBW0_9STRA|nr:serine/threonine protein kinase containing WD-40 repeat domain [Nitzschia inconspicua]